MAVEAIKAAFEMTRGALSRHLKARISAVGSVLTPGSAAWLLPPEHPGAPGGM